MVKVGVIGIGSMGQNHARVYSEIAELVGVADLDIDSCKKVATRFNTDCFSDYKDLLNTEVEVVSIVTPTKTHFSIAMDAIGCGKHILVEKPICSTIEEAEKLVQTARDAGVTLAIGHIERHNPVVGFAKTALKEDRYGEVITISSRRVSSFPSRIKDVGVVLDLGIHDIDVMRYLIESEVESVYTLGGRQQSNDFEDHANILLDFENGVTGFVEINWLTPMKVRKLSLTCLKNFVELDYITQSLRISSSQVMEYDTSNLYSIPFEFDIRDVALKKQEPLKIELMDFLAAVSEKKSPLVTGEDGVQTLKVAKAAIDSYEKKVKVDLDEFEE